MPPPVPERTNAKTRGDQFYHTGKPCRNGHAGDRYTSNGLCVTCVSLSCAKSRATRPWHPLRAAARGQGLIHFDTGKQCVNGHMSIRFVSNGDCVVCHANKHARWLAKHPGLEAKWARERRAKDPTGHRAEVRRHALKNPEQMKAALRRWKAENIEQVRLKGRISRSNYRAKQARNGGYFSEEDIRRLMAAQGGRCKACGCAEKLELDHIEPIAIGGSSDPSNLQFLCRPCNRSKGKREFLEWAKEKGYLA